MPKLVISVHGIRTFGQWQERLGRLVRARKPDTDYKTFRYGYFSAPAFLLPPLRWIVVWLFHRRIVAVIRQKQDVELTIFAHSFGTYVAAHGARLLSHRSEIRSIQLVLAGSVLPARFDWERLFAPGKLRRVVNDCGTEDLILIMSQLLVLGTGMAGRSGFIGILDHRLTNRYFCGGHSHYFERDGIADNNFMVTYWLPIVLTDLGDPVDPVDERPNLTQIGGAREVVLQNATPVKLALYGTALATALVTYLHYERSAFAVALLPMEEVYRSNQREAASHLAMSRPLQALPYTTAAINTAGRVQKAIADRPLFLRIGEHLGILDPPSPLPATETLDLLKRWGSEPLRGMRDLIMGPRAGPNALTFLPGGERVLVEYPAGIYAIWRLGTPHPEFDTFERLARISDDRRWIVFFDPKASDRLRFFDVEGGVETSNIVLPIAGVNRFTVSPKGRHVVVQNGDYEHELAIIDRAHGTSIVHSYVGEVRKSAMTSDGRYFVMFVERYENDKQPRSLRARLSAKSEHALLAIDLATGETKTLPDPTRGKGLKQELKAIGGSRLIYQLDCDASREVNESTTCDLGIVDLANPGSTSTLLTPQLGFNIEVIVHPTNGRSLILGSESSVILDGDMLAIFEMPQVNTSRSSFLAAGTGAPKIFGRIVEEHAADFEVLSWENGSQVARLTPVSPYFERKEALALTKGDAPTAFSVSGDGELFVTGYSSGAVRLWDANGANLDDIRLHSPHVTAVAASDNGRLVAAASSNGEVRVFDRDERRRTYRGNIIEPAGNYRIKSVAFAKDSSATAYIISDSGVWFLDTPTTLESRPLPVIEISPRYRNTSVDLSPDGTLAVTGGSFGYALVTRTSDMTPLARLDHQDYAIPTLLLGSVAVDAKFSPDGKYIATRGVEGVIKLWATPRNTRAEPTSEEKPIAILTEGYAPKPPNEIRFGAPLIANRASAFSFDPFGKRIAISTHDGHIQVWRVPEGDILTEIDTSRGVPVSSLDWHPTLDKLLVSYRDGVMQLWEIETGVPAFDAQHTWDADSYLVSAWLTWDGKYLISHGSDAIMRVWDGQTGQALLSSEHILPRIDAVVRMPDPGQVCVITRDGFVRFQHLHDEIYSVDELRAMIDRLIPYGVRSGRIYYKRVTY